MAKDDSLRPENSPSQPGVTDKPKLNVRGLSPIPVFIFGLVVAIVVAFLAYGIHKRGQSTSDQRESGVIANAGEGGGDSNYVQEWLANSPNSGMIPGEEEPEGRMDWAMPERPETAPEAEPEQPAAEANAPVPEANAPNDQDSRIAEEIRQRRMENMLAALDSDTSVSDNRQSQGQGRPTSSSYAGATQAPQAPGSAQATRAALPSGMGGGNVPAGLMGQENEYQAQNMQGHKQEFLSGQQGDQYRLNESRQALPSPFTIRTGTVIPGVMISGINSDLPGRMIAQVSQNVYDSATGEHLMIPQGSRLYGRYDSNVAMGQERVLIVWNRIIYPDGSTLNIQSMPGSDQEGFAGFHDQVDNHYWRTFGQAFMLSVIAGAAQLSQPDSEGQDGYDANQVMAAQLGQQFGQVGQEMIRRNMNIQPTLRIRKGYRFNIMITKDIVARPWQGQ
jgi:type IV secretion system protein VirB10